MAGDDRSVAGRLRRIWRHRTGAGRAVARRFDEAAFARIEQAISDGERGHLGEIRVAVEAELPISALWSGTSPRERALQVFAEHGVWDTERNSGVLIYLSCADRDVEIVADRAAHRALPAEAWEGLAAAFVAACRSGRPVDGMLSTIAAIDAALRTAMPVDGGTDVDELSNRPLRL